MPSQGAVLLFPVSLGPYTLRVELCSKVEFGRKNVNSEVDFNAGVMRIASHLQGRNLVIAFIKRLIGVIHYSHGLDDASVEEHYTHSFATGLMEFVRRNPQAWHWLNAMLSQHFSKGQRFERICQQAPTSPLSLPVRMTIWHRVIRLSVLPAKAADRAGVWGYYLYADQWVHLHEQLRGEHFAVIFWHELTHAFHHAAGMQDRETRRRFVNAQASAWLEFVSKNPGAWKWFVSLATHEKVLEAVQLEASA